ncbi:transposase, partial [Chitinimonas sp. PSY-7]|uniref:transposase n=1 Tax=Chitinimonas sp. PSY-7 TaxID=3459088 RepID=UPI00403FF902
NAIENINAQLRKIIKTRGHFPSDEAATKLIWLALRNITADWGVIPPFLRGVRSSAMRPWPAAVLG